MQFTTNHIQIYTTIAGNSNSTSPPFHKPHHHHRHHPPPPPISTMSAAAKRPRKRLKPSPPPQCPDIEDLHFTKHETLEIRKSLLGWYDLNQRDLPWRTISSGSGSDREIRAYAVWVSEIMLQQTRVNTVIGYFNRWINKWPTIYHLAKAEIEEVNEMWAGLGYYRRARFLLEGAKMIVEEGSGFPNTVSTLRNVKGIGDYTAGAIASIAFNEVVPVVDGNVVRVIARLKAISANPKDKVTVKIFWNLAGQLVDSCRPGDFNQALMELGATICTPLSPKCSSCPISAQCQAFALSQQKESSLVTDYPSKVIKPQPRHECCAVSFVEIRTARGLGLESCSKFLLVKRPNKGLLAGLWEFPSVLLEAEVDLAARREAVDHFLKSSLNLAHGKDYKILLREDVGDCVHVFSHIRLKMYIELLVLEAKGRQSVTLRKHNAESVEGKYVDSQELGRMGLTSGVRKVYSMIQKHKQCKLSSTSSNAGAKKKAGAKKAFKK